METNVAWIAGMVLSVIGWGTLVHFTWIARTWPRARGRVVGNISEWAHGSPGDARRAVHFPEIEFDAGGPLHRAKGGVGRSKPWAIGEPVELFYKPSNPDHLLDLNLWQRLVFSGAFIVMGALSLAAAMGVVR
jgi:hypothetical protein